MTSLLTLGIYGATWAFILGKLSKRQNVGTSAALPYAVAAGLLVHALAIYQSIVQHSGLQLGIFNIASVFFFVMNLLVLLSSLRMPLHNLFLFLMPLSAVSVAISEFFDTPLTLDASLSPGMLSHILLSILAYSLLTLAAIQALLIAYQNKQLREKHFHGVMGIMPPLQTMERLLFDMVWAGFLLLTLSIVTGAIYIEDLLAQQLSHKTVFSLLSWGVYAVLLAGHQVYGWRGPSAVRWVLGGFAALMLAYFGSKFVLEVVLG